MRIQRGLVLLFFAAACGGGGDDVMLEPDAEAPPDGPSCFAEPTHGPDFDYIGYFIPYRDDGAASPNQAPPPDPNDPGTIETGLILDGTIPPANPFDFVLVQMNRGVGAFPVAIEPGTYAIAGDETSLDTCGLCLIFFADATLPASGGIDAEQFFLASGGEVIINEINPNLDFELVDVTFVEVDGETGAPITNGCATTFDGAFLFEPTADPGCVRDAKTRCWIEPAVEALVPSNATTIGSNRMMAAREAARRAVSH